MTAWRTSPNRQPGFPRQGRLHRSAPRWLLFVPVTIAAVLVLLGGLIVTFNQRTSALPLGGGCRWPSHPFSRYWYPDPAGHACCAGEAHPAAAAHPSAPNGVSRQQIPADSLR